MKPKHDPLGPLLDMHDYALRVVTLTQGQSEHSITRDNNWQLQASLERCLELIGEAANRIAPDFQKTHPEIPWAGIIGMRNLLIHGYDSVLPSKLWETATAGIAELLPHLSSLIKSIQPPSPP
jgi:uncharacterized protein with HEPN domain